MLPFLFFACYLVTLFLRARYAGKVVKFNKEADECLTVHHYHGTPVRDVGQRLRAWTGADRLVLVELEDVFMTFPDLDTIGRMRKAVKGKLCRWLRDARAGKKPRGIMAVAISFDLEDPDSELDCPGESSDSSPEDPKSPVDLREKRRTTTSSSSSSRAKRRNRRRR